MDSEMTAKSTQEQAVAAWINYLNQLRIDQLVERLHQQDINLQGALEAIDGAARDVDCLIESNRGGDAGIHGFIAEVAEVGVSNARRLVVGESANVEWVNDNGPADLLRDGAQEIQMKFVNSGGRFSLGAVAEHLKDYPDFVTNGGKYQIPSDHYDMVKLLAEMPKDEAGRLSSSGDGPSWGDWQRVHEFFDETGLDLDSLESSKLSYRDVQRNTIDATLDRERENLRETDQEARNQAHEESKPSAGEAVKATAVAAVVEGGTALVVAIRAKQKQGKRISEFSQDDWAEVLGAGGKGSCKGAIRGGSVYALTNYTATPAAVASALITASFGVAEQAYRLRLGEIGEVEFIEASEIVALDAAVSAFSSFVGQAVIPVPVVGAVIGNAVGTVMYQAAKDGLSRREQALIERYCEELRALDERLSAEHREYVLKMDACMDAYVALLERAFSPDVAKALEGSIELARELGVPAGKILDTREKAAAYFS